MRKFGKNIKYTNCSYGNGLNKLMRNIKRLVQKDLKNERHFRITFSEASASIKVYAIQSSDSKMVLVETLAVTPSGSVPDLKTLSFNDYITRSDVNDLMDDYIFYYDAESDFTPSLWKDQGRHLINAEQSVLANQPSYSSGAIVFNGSTDYMVLDDEKKLCTIKEDENFAIYIDFERSSDVSGFLFSSYYFGPEYRGFAVKIESTRIFFGLYGQKDADGAYQDKYLDYVVGTTRKILYIAFDRINLEAKFYLDNSLIGTLTGYTDPGEISTEPFPIIGKLEKFPIQYFNGKIYKMYLNKTKITI